GGGARRPRALSEGLMNPSAVAVRGMHSKSEARAPSAALGMTEGVPLRGRWVRERLREMPQYVIFLYNTLLDQSIEWRYKVHVFATLRYLFDDIPGVIPDNDPLLRRLDDLCMVLRCFAELV